MTADTKAESVAEKLEDALEEALFELEAHDSAYAWALKKVLAERRTQQERIKGLEWQPIESAPLDGTPVDLWCHANFVSGGPGRVSDCWFYENKWWRYDDVRGDAYCRAEVHNATHWMATPKAPLTASLPQDSTEHDKGER